MTAVGYLDHKQRYVDTHLVQTVVGTHDLIGSTLHIPAVTILALLPVHFLPLLAFFLSGAAPKCRMHPATWRTPTDCKDKLGPT